MKNSNVQYSSFENAPYMPLPRNRNHAYWKELEEVLPQKVKLAKDLQLLLKPVNTYNSWNHKSYIYGTSKCLDNPLNIIKNAYNMKVDTSLYQKNRNYYSNLYKSMRSADIPHSDILSIWGNPYIGTVTKWNELSWQRKQNLKLQYPEMEKLAEDIAEQKRNFYDILRNNIYSPAQRFLDEYGFAISAIASTHPYGKATVGLVRTGQAIVAIAPKMVKLITTLGSVELARQFQILQKQTSGNDTPKPRLGTFGFKEGQYWSGLNPVNTPAANRQIGKINKQAFGGGEVRTDGTYVYRFDPKHQTAKVHIEMYKKTSKGWKPYAEKDPNTGKIIEGSVQRLRKRSPIKC